MYLDHRTSREWLIQQIARNEKQADQLHKLDMELHELMMKIIYQECTEKQVEIVQLILIGMTQMEVAKNLKKSQSCVQKTLKGNYDATANLYYGGVRQKLQKLLPLNKAFQSIMKQMEDLPFTGLQLPHFHTFKKCCFKTYLDYDNWLQQEI